MRIGIVRYWMGRPAAEHETVERFKRAALMVDHEIVELRPDGKTHNGESPDIDFIINLHFASGKSTPHLTYGALWNPIAFYSGWGFSKTFSNQISNDFLVGCGSKKINAMFTGEGLPEIIPQVLSHTVPPEYKAPVLRGDRKLFYIGVNWEKSSNRQGRHHELLKGLDDLGILEIYGPKKLGNVEPWKGFKSYQGELPFDGTSVIEAANKAGAVLTLSSQDHLRDEIMTSRFFEGLASGAAIIGDSHPFFEENFRDEVWQFDDTLEIEDQCAKIASLLDEINGAPAITVQKITAGQSRLFERFNLATQLNDMAAHARAQIDKKNVSYPQFATAIVFMTESILEIHRFLDSLKAAGFKRVVVITNCRQDIPDLSEISVIRMSKNSSFYDFAAAYYNQSEESEFISFFSGHETVFPDYLEPVNNLAQEIGAVVLTGACVEEQGEFYASSINGSNAQWRAVQLSSLIIRKSYFDAFMKDFRSFSMHAFINKNVTTLVASGFVKLDQLVRFRYTNVDPNLDKIQGVDFHNLRNQIRGGWSPSPSNSFNHKIFKEIRIETNQDLISTDGRYLIVQIYRSLRVPSWADQLLRRLGPRFFK